MSKDILSEAIYRWNEMVNNAVGVNLSKSCDSPCNAAFSSNCVALCFLGMESPFKEGSDLDCDWQDMLYFYRLWRDYTGTATCAYKKRFVKFGKKLVDAHPSNPFIEEDDVSYEALREHDLKVAEKKDKASGTYVPVEVPKDRAKIIEEDWMELEGVKAVEKIEAEPPRRFFNIFRRRRNG